MQRTGTVVVVVRYCPVVQTGVQVAWTCVAKELMFILSAGQRQLTQNLPPEPQGWVRNKRTTEEIWRNVGKKGRH